MGKRLLASFLAAAMMLTMAPFAFAIENTEDTIDADQIPAAEEAVDEENQIETQSESALQQAINNATDGSTVTMSENEKADITINKSITLDLNNKTLTNTNAGKATITVANGATVTVQNGFVVGGKSYYNIEVKAGGTLTLEDVTATAGNSGSSMIDNWGTLTISSGDYSGGLNVVKSEEDSKLTIDGGKFTLDYAPSSGYTATILVYGDTTITGGEFIQNATPKWGYPQVVMTGVVEGYTAITKITGGTFTNKKSGDNIFHGLGKATSDNFEVSGGTFNKSISDGYCADGFIPTKNADGTYGVKEGKYVAAVGSKKYETLADAIRLAAKGKTVKLLNDVDLPGNVVIDKSITLDLNGKKLYNTVDIWNESNALVRIKNGADVTITGNGTMSAKENDCYAIAVVKGNLTIENGTFIGNVSAVQVEEGHLAIKGGKFDLLQKWDGSKFLINCIDEAYRDGTAKVSITGGTFVDFNPANCQAEGEGTNFLATGYITTKVGNNYVVKAGTNKNISDLDTAINTIKNATSSKNDKNAAVDVIKNIDNADLANNSAAMGKLAALDNTLTDTTSGSAKVTVTSNSTATGIESSEVAVTNAALSADLTSAADQSVVVTIANNNAITDDAVAAAKEAAGINDDVAVQKLNISMTVNGEKVEKPTAPVVLEFPLPNSWKGCQIVCVDDATHPELIPTTVIGNKVKATFNHFSDYAMLSKTVVANPNEYQIELTPKNHETTVYAGDTITFDIVLKRIEGNSDTINRFRFTPTSDMLMVTGGTAKNGFQYDEASKEFRYLDASNPITLTNGQIKVGTVTCKVNNNAANRRNLVVTVGDQDTVTVAGYQKSNGLTVAEIPVEYDAIRVYFTNYKGQLDGDGNEATECKTFYTSAGNTKLYDSLDDMVNGTPATDIPAAVDGSITNGTQYRLTYDGESENLKNWLAADGTTKYVDVVTGTGFAGTMSFYVSRVELLEVDKPDTVTIDSKTTMRGSKTYVDKNADFTFNVPGAATGMKNEVTVTVGGTAVTPAQDTTNKNKYTVANTAMNASPVTIAVNQVIDLNVDDIKVFEDGGGKFLQYSKYSDEDTLVLIKGAAGVKYTLNPNTGTEAPEIYKLPTDHGYGDFNLAVLIPRPTMTAGEDARAIMLKYLTDTYHIAVATGDNTSINAYDFDTNADGNGSGTFKLDDAQATYDFGSIPKAQMYWEPSDVELLKADVLTYADKSGVYNTSRDGQVTSSDVDAFLYNYVYTLSKRPNT